jgi:Zn-dependent protease
MLGIPLEIDPSLLVVIVIVATTAHTTGAVILAFVLGGGFSLIAHETGHALAANQAGATGVRISLSSLGGTTHYRLPTPSRLRTLMITAAGPATGLVLGAIVWLLRSAADPAPFSSAANVYRQLLFVTVGWSLINLLPVLPLDGGTLLENLLVGSTQDRRRIAAIISILVAGVAAEQFWRHDLLYPAVLFAILAAVNVFLAAHGAAAGSSHRHNTTCEVFRLISAENPLAAAEAARTAGGVDPALSLLLDVLLRDDRVAEQQLWRRYERNPNDAWVRSSVVILRAHRQDWNGILAMLQVGVVKNGAVQLAMTAAYRAGAFVEAANIGEATLRVNQVPRIAFNTARAWSRSGNNELALGALMRAVQLGWADWRLLDADPDLASLREAAAFRSWRLTVLGSTPRAARSIST